MPVTSWWVGVLAASAAPTFVADALDDEALALRAWEAGVACTGREGTATDEVLVVHRTIPGGWLGVAHTDPAGRLHRIDVAAEGDRAAEVIVHEVSHAWISIGPVALVEGTAQLLADCIAARLDGAAPLQWDDGRELSGLPDLVGWTPAGEHEPNELGVIRTDAYLGASRLMRTVSLVVPPAELWADHVLDWPELRAALATRGEPGARILTALDAGGIGQRHALADDDHDGLSALAESLSGTSDLRFDTDGDGWWDGADRPAGALAVPLDGTPICTGLAAPADGAGVRVTAGGNLRGEGVSAVVARPGSRPRGWSGITSGRAGTPRLSYVPGHDPLLVQLDAAAPSSTAGAVWATFDGPALVPDTSCRSTAGFTVWAADHALAPSVHDVAVGMDAALTEVEVRFGPATQRLAVALGGTWTGIDHGIVWVSSAEVEAAARSGALGDVARLAVAAHLLAASGDHNWKSAEALALSLR